MAFIWFSEIQPLILQKCLLNYSSSPVMVAGTLQYSIKIHRLMNNLMNLT